MRALVVLAVLGVCCAFPHQAYNPLPPYPSYGNSYPDPPQPKWTGPMASEVPAGIDGQIIPVADTYEVSAAKKSFFDAYQKQLSAVGGGAHYAPNPAAHYAPGPAAHYGPVAAPVYNAIPVAPAYVPKVTVPKVPAYSPPVHAKHVPAYVLPVPASHVPAFSHPAPVKHVPAYASAAPSPNSLSVYGAVPKDHLQDTPEVAAAKAQFFHLYNEQAAAAAAAPDDPIDYNTYH